jgi:Amt family ammonium transporter
MAVGYTLLESAQVRKKNRRHIMTKNLMIILISLLSFFLLGYAFAFGHSSGGVVGGQSEYAGVYTANELYHERQFPFYFATCLIVGLILTGSMSERTRLEPLLFFTLVLNLIIYPPVLSWSWNLQGGFLRDLGFLDRGGCAVIFVTGAMSGIIGAIVVGPRYGRFMPKADEQKIFTVQAATANNMMMMYHYKDKDTSTVTSARINSIQKQKTLKGMLEETAKGSVNLDDLYLRKLRKKIKHATKAIGEDHDFYKIDN